MLGRFATGAIGAASLVAATSLACAQSKSPPPSPNAASSGTPAVVVDLQTMDSVIGKDVRSVTGEDLGHLIDLLVGTNGQARAAIIDFGGVLGVGSRKVAVDWQVLSFADSAKGGAIKLSLTRDQVRVAPEFRSGEPVVILEGAKTDPPPAPRVPVAAPVPAPPSTPTPAAQSPAKP